MTDPSLQTLAPDLWTTLRGVFMLDPRAFEAGLRLKDGVLVAAAIVLLAAFSEAVGQSVVLFANRVKPGRFLYSVLISGLLFAFGYAFVTLSTWAITYLPLAKHIPLPTIAAMIALSYAPLMLSFLEALPYLGAPIGWGLRVWYLLASLVGITAVGHVPLRFSILYVGLGWLFVALGRQTIGHPIAMLGMRIMSLVSGVSYDEDENKALQRGQAAPGGLAGGDKSADAPASARRPAKKTRAAPKRFARVFGYLTIIVVGVIIAISIEPLQRVLFGWTGHLPGPLRLPFDVLWLGVVALLVAAIIAPLETLGWWAGWYGKSVGGAAKRTSHAKTGAKEPSRYLIYLDGVGQSSSKYTPDVETFLDALAPELPKDVRLLRGLMVYSVLNKPLEEDPLWARFWAAVDKMRFTDPRSVLGMFVNVRNMLIVAVSADSRYGPIYNYGIAQLLYNGLVKDGYRVGGGIPVTLMGYSGGAQMATASVSSLLRAIKAPIDVISLGGVMSGTSDFLDLKQLEHLVGTKDGVERLGRLLFASRWRIVWYSNWNRAKRRDIIHEISLGRVGHQVPGGMFDPKAKLPSGETNLQHTIDTILDALNARA